MQNIIIRRITSSDIEDIYILNCQLGYAFSKEKVKERIDYILNNTKDIVLTAEIDKQVVGYIHGSPYELLYSDSLINLLGLVVKENYRNLGIGSKLINDMETWAKENNFTGIKLESGFERLDAHKFYQNHGYIIRKNHKSFYKILD